MPSGFNIQNPYAAQEMEIARRQKLAQMLQQQAMQPIQAPQGGAFAAPASPLQVIGNAMLGYAGKKQGDEAMQRQQALQQTMQQDRAAALAKALQASQAQPMQMDAADNVQTPAMPADPSRGMAALAQSGDPALMQYAPIFQMQQQSQNAATGRQHDFDLAKFKHGLESPKAPPTRERRSGDLVIQEQMKSDGTWVEIGRGSKFKTTPDTQVVVDNKGESEYAKKVSGLAGERDIGQHDTAMAALDNIIKIDQQLDLMKNSQAITGLGSEILKNTERARALFLQDKQAGKRVSDTELLDALLGQDVFPMIKQLGIGARGLDTPAERDFLRNVMTGTTPLNRDTLIRLAEIRRDISERAIKRWNERVGSGELDRYFRATGMPKKTIDLPQPKRAPGAAPEGIDPAVWNLLSPEQKALWQN